MLDGFIPEEKEEIPLEQHFCLFWNLYFEIFAWDIFRVYWLCCISHKGCPSLGYPAVCWLLFPIWQGFLFRCVCRAAGLSREEKRQQSITWPKNVFVAALFCSFCGFSFNERRQRKKISICSSMRKNQFSGEILAFGCFLSFHLVGEGLLTSLGICCVYSAQKSTNRKAPSGWTEVILRKNFIAWIV